MARGSQSAGARKHAQAKGRPKVLVLHGSNGITEAIAGSTIPADDAIAVINSRLEAEASAAAVELVTFRSERQEALAARIQSAAEDGVRFVVIDAAALVDPAGLLRAALTAVSIPFIQVHLSNVQPREQAFDRNSPAPHAGTAGTIVGLGAKGYELALIYALRHVKD